MTIMYDKVHTAINNGQIVLWNNGEDAYLRIITIKNHYAFFQNYSIHIDLDNCCEEDFLFCKEIIHD